MIHLAEKTEWKMVTYCLFSLDYKFFRTETLN